MKSETQTKKMIVEPNLVPGKWKLTYDLENTLKSDGFSGRMLSSYQHPITRQMVHLLDDMGRPIQLGYWIGTLTTYLFPDKEGNQAHYNAILFLLGHPDVGVEGIPIDEKWKKSKKSNPKAKLVNLDYANQVEMDDQEIVDQMIGRLSLDLGKHAVGLEKLQYVLATLNKPFYDKRYINDARQLKKKLRKEVKDFVREGSKNAKTVEQILDNVEDAKKAYVIKMLLTLEEITYSSGSYKHNTVPMGFNIESTVDYLKRNPDHYATLLDVLDKSMEKQKAASV
ncbi:MAG: hypothetical protein EX254_10480 [Flavobacteriaceae bacterium]|nr:MAG: hypothetical protein EX254_10480 [Flavobacteriaceae bacterium]